LEAERGRRLDRAFEDVTAERDPRERAFAHELVYGTTRLRGRLDHLIGLRLHHGLAELDARVLEVLRLGAYQLLYMGGVPAYAAVSQAVEQVRAEVGAGPTGLVNAVLRKVGQAGDGPEHFPDFETDPLAFLETWGSHPRWLVERWLARWGVDEVRALIEANNRRPSHFMVPLDEDPVAAATLLESAALPAIPVGEGTRCVRLGEGAAPAMALSVLPHAIIQDPAANLVALYTDVPRGTKVADLCAAPGGKALAVADRPFYTLAADRSESRLHMLRDNARRTGRHLGLAVADARRPPLRRVDVVILDAPCTGTGTLQRRPDARWRLSPGSLADLVELQRELLAAAAHILPPGGLLSYSTCSLEIEENDQQVDDFLATHPDFRVESSGAIPRRYLNRQGCLWVTPQSTGFDGAFAARMRRAG
jgi:16S rRNA (cytosine967-C5)-methyltransferase